MLVHGQGKQIPELRTGMTKQDTEHATIPQPIPMTDITDQLWHFLLPAKMLQKDPQQSTTAHHESMLAFKNKYFSIPI